MSDDLAAFLLARVAEDEAVARAAKPGPWRWDRKPVDDWGHQPPDLVTTAEKEYSYTINSGEVRTYMAPVATVVSSWGHDADGVVVDDEDAEHIARHNPARALAECATKRAVVEDFALLHRDYRETHSPTTEARRFQAAVTMGRMAAVYADHSDYRDEWKP